MLSLGRDPTLPQEPYDPDKQNAGIVELKRQEAAGEELDWDKAWQALYEKQGLVFEIGWVKDEPYSQANWEGDGA